MNIKLNDIEIELTPNIKLNHLHEHGKGAKWWLDILDFLERWANDSQNIEIQTSGSTGQPKVMEVKKSMLWISASKTCSFFNLSETSTGLLCLSASYIAGQMMLVRAMVSKMKLICIEPSSDPINELKQNISFAALVPLQVQSAVCNPNKFNNIENIIIGGGQVSKSLCSKLNVYKGKAFETYGMTETLSHIALKQLRPKYEEVFKLLPGININQSNSQELIVNYPELGIDSLKTNDIIELHNDGSFKWLGRTDFVINSGGIKISPEVIEKQIEDICDRRICVIGKPDEKLGEKIVLIIEGKAFDTQSLVLKLKENLPTYHLPKEICFLPQLPLTENGKLNRKEILFVTET